ncbi:hypothetical protein GPECTOR_105g96 [Gonium pectorale]|uniref:Sialate O-acetylesterase domain-containing protein n=1 Tax=Gonium pectorale TaxID=33097 RepID=A0A150FZP4_GONPE|nr:hypothetical protein GPECTOR_105g96 [Gonium pectorale]|eukprot:KXZ43064.1 hypothetical protein GPECTOR_105g96 [Gonium pectorale]
MLTYGDNQGAQALVRNPIIQQRSKHIDVLHHFVRERTERGDNSRDGTPMPAASQPVPGRLLMYDSTWSWHDARPSVHMGMYGFDHQLPIVLGVMAARKRGNMPHIAKVRAAQLALTLPALVKVDLAGFEFFEEYGGFHVHLTKDGACALGAAMAHAFYAASARGLVR